jgi:hypothetical protein
MAGPPWNAGRQSAFSWHEEFEAMTMTAAFHMTRVDNGPDLAKAAAALAIAGACIGLLIFLLTPIPGDATTGVSETDQLHWQRPAGDAAVKLIPI